MQPLGRIASYLWDIISWNVESLLHDTAAFAPRDQPKPAGPYHLVNDAAIHLGQDVTLSPGCVLDASDGPILIADGVAIGANAVILGPCYIGLGTQISPLALIRAGTSLGSRCKVGGEVSNALFMDCSSKAHEGFVGDSYIGQWVNFGAGSCTSNLKNTYGGIHVRLGKQPIPTGRQFLGSLVGDHTKFAISTRLMTGSYIGYCCMIAAAGLTPTHVPSFTFLTDQGARNYERDKAKEMMTSVFKRRRREWEAGDDEMMEYAGKAAGEVEK
jgi:UDP-N-acetylglucosamine diphosphorylase/glucosamine-1-phosphate N-acetyltransferase